MAVVYVREQGAFIKKVDERIVVEKNCKNLADVPLREISGLSIMGNIQISTQAVQMLLRAGVDISYFTYSGKYIGHAFSGSSKNVFLRLAQYELYDNMERRLEYARVIVANKITNQIAVIKNYNWSGIEYDYSKEVILLKSQILSLADKKTTNQIMGVEGNCSSIYFSVMSHMFKSTLKFDKRTRRPPKDPINVILSLAYTLLTKEMICTLESESFETYLGFLHGIKYGRQSLALDIIEEFRQLAIDRLVLYVFNKNILGELDFEYRDGKVILLESGFQKFCKQYEKWMNAPVCVHDNRTFRQIMKNQVQCLKKSINENIMYKPFEWREPNVLD